jgi:hypothetical protein
MRMLILAHVQGRPVREMRASGRLAPRVNNPQFEAELTNIADDATSCRSSRTVGSQLNVVVFSSFTLSCAHTYPKLFRFMRYAEVRSAGSNCISYRPFDHYSRVNA